MDFKNRFWKDKFVLVTGFEGFLGSHLTKALILRGAKIIGLDIKTNRRETIFTPSEYKKIKVIKGDVANFSLIKEIISTGKINIIFHLAAEALVENGYARPLKAFKSNICGTWNILEACRLCNTVEAIVVASSDKAYGEHKNLPYKEDYSLNGKHPYDVSKSCADLIAGAYFNSYNLPVAVTRCGNIYGPGDFNFSRLIPDAMRCLVFNKRLDVRSDGKFVRDYVYIDDIVAGYIKITELLAERKVLGEVFNLSDEQPVTVIKVLEEINKIYSDKRRLNYKVMNTAKYEIKKQCLSSAKARRILGWKPDFNLSDGLRETSKWYTEYFSRR